LLSSHQQPRLGPKPFTSGQSGDFSFDKVFSVPAVPGSDGNGDTNKENISMESDSPPTSISPVKEKSEEEEGGRKIKKTWHSLKTKKNLLRFH
jgi:hypothetical protein